MHYYQRGFTIVELSIVIVVIGILASITAVVYSGTQDRSRAATSESAGMTVVTKAETAYSATSQYPTSLTGSSGFDRNPDSSLAGSGITLASIGTRPNNAQTVSYESCGIGARIGWWDYENNTLTQKTLGATCTVYTPVVGTP